VTTLVGMTNVNAMLPTIHPMLADTSDTPLAALAGTHLFDQKLDGIRALAAWGPDGLTMRNRSGRDISLQYPDIEDGANGTLRKPAVLDGEIIATTGAFQDIARRDKQRTPTGVLQAMREVPATFVAFDVLWAPDRGDVRGLPYCERRDILLGMGVSGFGWDTSTASTDPGFYDAVRIMGGEGVVAKRLTSVYRHGRRSDWLKYKATYTVTCVAIGYEPGNGSRSEMGAILLGLIKDGQVVLVGKAGSGFTLPESLAMKGLLDAVAAGTSLDLPLVEIECLSVTRDGKLRQPVFKGQRTDLTLAAAQHAQLDTIPKT
jgi:bifunctional non-homologous end joining protein LigD